MAWSRLRLGCVGVAFGALFFCLSLTPSLLPGDGGSRADRRRHRRHRRRHRCRDRQDVRPHGAARAQLLAAEPGGAVPRQGRERGASAGASVPTANPSPMAAAGVGADGHPGPVDAGPYKDTDHRRRRRRAVAGVSRVLIDAVRVFARYLIRRWQVNDEVAKFIVTAIVVALVITVVEGR